MSLESVCAQLSHRYAALGALEKTMCTFAVPRAAKLGLFDTLLTPTLFYGVEMWGPILNKANNWKDLERPLVIIIARMI